MSNDRTYFFNSLKSNICLIGSIKGKFVSILVIDDDRPLTRSEIAFNAKLMRCGGEHYTIRSMEDLTEIAKIKGWIDD